MSQNNGVGLTYTSGMSGTTFGGTGTFTGGTYGTGTFTSTPPPQQTGGWFQNADNVNAVGNVLGNILGGIAAIKNGGTPQQVTNVANPGYGGGQQPVEDKSKGGKTTLIVLAVVAIIGIGAFLLMRKKG